MTTTTEPGSDLPLQKQERVVIRFAGDSGDGMQITGNQFTSTSAAVGNDLATLPDFPAEIRAPAGTRPGVSGFQLCFSSIDIHTPGDNPDVLVAMNPAALAVNIGDLKTGGVVIANTGNFTEKDLKKARVEVNPLEDDSLEGYRVIKVDINKRVAEALDGSSLSTKEVQRCKNFYTLGLMYWLYSRPLEPTEEWLRKKFAKRAELAEANITAMRAGFAAGDIHEMFQGRFEVPAAELTAGTYRKIMGNQALALGLISGAELAGLKAFLGSYPITPASSILETMASFKRHGVVTFQAEDEIAAICAAIGASFTGSLGMTTTSGPGIALKSEAMGLGVCVELPLVIVNVQRGGPSTGLPTKTEQADLLQAVFGRNGEAPIPVLAVASPSDGFDCAIEACRIAVEYMTPVILLSDGYIANGAEPWRLPDVDALPSFEARFEAPRGEGAAKYMPYSRGQRDERPWAVPGTEGAEHRVGGLEKEHLSGEISYDAENHEFMVLKRQEKVMGIRASIPTPTVRGPQGGDLLILGWGSTYGTIIDAADRCARAGTQVSTLHMRHLWPLPDGLDELFGRFKAILIPEINLGQLARILRGEYPHHNFISFPKVQGRPFLSTEIVEKVSDILER
ncbi:MAG: 2-oxoacid:acceptor oxidoreductase subunit alpha [Planctomycetota bacterium]|jgi:2-oxoglutarate ferredoxin oxidoreductase subunit alpha|nr:2-oxoacid:acceptor oxidoreductase subunit alpha [Planctomycetota bacterium]MDP6989914.1 2-oxoacid:acceptor oxidoreductase subunit alpha [Planctomycetota bacterium]